MIDILDMLAGGDRRSIGRANEVVAVVLADPSLFGAVFAGMNHDDPVTRMRAADVVEKVTAQRPEWLVPHRRALLYEVASVQQQEVRWHVAQMIPRLTLTEEELPHAVETLRGYLGDKSRIVRTFAMQALADLVKQDPSLKTDVLALVRGSVDASSPAVRSRARKLLLELGEKG